MIDPEKLDYLLMKLDVTVKDIDDRFEKLDRIKPGQRVYLNSGNDDGVRFTRRVVEVVDRVKGEIKLAGYKFINEEIIVDVSEIDLE